MDRYQPRHRPGETVIIEQRRGRLDRQPGVAIFPGAAEALQAAVAWQQHERPGTDAVIAVTVAELNPNRDRIVQALQQ